MAKKKYTTVEENLARRKYYNGTRPVATTNSGMGPVYVNTGDGKTADTYTPSQVHTFNLNGNRTANTAANSAPQVPTLDTTNKPTYTPQAAFEYQSTYQPKAFTVPEAYQAPNAADYMKGNYNVGDFNSQWGNKLNSLYNEIAGRGKFSYDQSKDPLYQQYAEMYRKNAQLAMSDTVAKAASLTGGYGNSYAETAGQSMYNQTMDNLNERALDLYDRALNAWALEGENLNQRFNMAGQMYNNDYNAWRAKMQDAQYQQQFDYNRYLNDRDFGYNQWADNYNRARAEWEYDDQMNYQRDQDAWNRAWQQHTYAGDEARYAYEAANNDWRYANDYALDVYDRENQNYWNQQNLDFDREKFDWQKDSWQQEFDWNVGRDARDYERSVLESDRDFAWGQETYNRDDAFRYDQLGYQDKWNQQDLDYNYARLGEDSRQFNLGYGLDAFNAGYDPVTGKMTDEAKARQDAADRFNYWQAGYDPATGTYSQDAQSRYKDSLALDYAKLGMNPDGSLNAIGQMEQDKLNETKLTKDQIALINGDTPKVQKIIYDNLRNTDENGNFMTGTNTIIPQSEFKGDVLFYDDGKNGYSGHKFGPNSYKKYFEAYVENVLGESLTDDEVARLYAYLTN